MNGLAAFREGFMTSDNLDDTEFGSIEARFMRYKIYWSFFESTAYRNIHRWATKLRFDYGLYKFVRNIYNPSYRLAEWWQAHLLAGVLDPAAGDGVAVPSALPIITKNETLRPAIAQIWKWSNWAFKKDTLGLWGPILGDAFIKINDDTEKQKVYLELVHPGIISQLQKDDFGNIKGYTIEQEIPDPQNPAKKKKYKEVAYREGDNVVYETYLDGKPFANTTIDEDGAKTKTAVWKVPYGFVPMVAIQHNDVGLNFGWSELHPGIPKIRELDDVTSKLNDQIRKIVDSPWLFAGVDKPGTSTKATGSSNKPEVTNPEEAREEIPIFYGPPTATATPIVAPMDIGQASEHCLNLLKEIERDYPELTVDINVATGDISGRALRLHRQPVEDKVNLRRPNYDDGIVRAHEMAVAIGGMRGYPGFEGFGLESYGKGDLEHTIGERPVFRKDPLDDLENETELWNAAAVATKSISLPIFLKRRGWTKEQIAEIEKSPEYQAKIAGLQAAQALSNSTIANPNAKLPPVEDDPDNMDTGKQKKPKDEK